MHSPTRGSALLGQPLAGELDRLGEQRLPQLAGRSVGIDTHSRKTLPAGANGSPSPFSMSSVTRSRGSFTTRQPALSS